MDYRARGTPSDHYPLREHREGVQQFRPPCDALLLAGGVMIQHGVAPFLECSSKGDKRFSAFYARLRTENNRTIEDLYQCSKVINGKLVRHWREGKGKRADNAEYV